MASAFDNNIGTELIVTGEQSGIWGVTTNNNLTNVLGKSIYGSGTLQLTADANTTFNVPQNSGATNGIRAANLVLTSSLPLTATRTVTLASPSSAGIEKLYSLQNNTTGGQSIVLRTTGGGTAVTIPTGRRMLVILDGTDVKEQIDYIAGALKLGGAVTFDAPAGSRASLGIGTTLPRNWAMNGGMQVAQRCDLTTAANALGDTLTSAGAFKYGKVDRMKVSVTSTTLTAGTFTQVANSTCGRTGYAAKLSGLTTTGATTIAFRTHIEAADAAKFVNDAGTTGQDTYISIIVRHDVGSSQNYTVELRRANAADDFSATTQIAISGSQAVLDSAATTIVLAVSAATMASAANQNGLQINVSVAPGAVTTKNFEWTELQAELSTAQTPFEYEAAPSTLLKCKRFFEKTLNGSVAPAQNAGTGGALQAVVHNAAVINLFQWLYEIEKRATGGTFTYFNPSAANALVRDITAGNDGPGAPTNTDQGTKSAVFTAGNAAAGDRLGLHVSYDIDF